jgi:hypothetical protein
MGSAPVRDREQSMWGAWKLRHLRRREHGLNILTRVYVYIYTQLQYICIIGTLGPALCIPNHCCPCCHGANGENMQDADAAAGAAVATVEIAALKRQFKLSEMSG